VSGSVGRIETVCHCSLALHQSRRREEIFSVMTLSLETIRLLREPSAQRWLLEAGTLVCILTIVWGKLVYFSILVPSEWWATPESIIVHIRFYGDVVSVSDLVTAPALKGLGKDTAVY
jgi:hypothetical protein